MSSIPLLRTTVTDAGIRLELGTWSYGNGATLETAADDLVRRLSDSRNDPSHQRVLIHSGSRHAGRDFVDFLWELSEVADTPEAVRHTLFG